MRTLFLARHAKSSWNDPSLADFERPLNGRGERNAPEMGRRLASRYPPPDIITSSPAVRARTTASILAGEWAFAGEITLEPTLYEASPSQMLSVANALPDEAETAMLVGHNPTITLLANLLGDLSIGNAPTCAVIILRFACAKWEEVEPEAGELVEFEYPKKPQAREEPPN